METIYYLISLINITKFLWNILTKMTFLAFTFTITKENLAQEK